MIKPSVIDLSHWNSIPESLKPAKASGILGIIHKASEGAGVVDDKLQARYALAREAGMLFGVYHFIRPGNLDAQLQNFVRQSSAVEHDQMLIALDYEDPAVSLDDVKWFMRALAAVSQRSPVLYSGHVLKEKLAGVADPELSRYRLWLAQYGSKPVLPPGWSNAWLWQYTDKGEVPGITPPTDVNVYRGNDAQLVAEWSGVRAPIEPVEPEEPDVEPAPAPDLPLIKIVVESSTPVRVVVEQTIIE